MRERQRKVKESERCDMADQESRRPNGLGRDRRITRQCQGRLVTNLNTDPSEPSRRDCQLPTRPATMAVSSSPALLHYLGSGTEDTASWL